MATTYTFTVDTQTKVLCYDNGGGPVSNADAPRFFFGDIPHFTLKFPASTFSEGDVLVAAIDTDKNFIDTTAMSVLEHTITAEEASTQIVEIDMQTRTQRFVDCANNRPFEVKVFFELKRHFETETEVENESGETETVTTQTDILLCDTFAYAKATVAQYGDPLVILPSQYYYTKEQINEIADGMEEIKQDAIDAKDAAETAQGKAEDARDDAESSATLSESYAKGGTNTRTGEDTDNSKYYKEQAAGASTDATTARNAAQASATLSESYAKGGTNTRSGEDTDNSKYYKEQADSAKQAASNSASAASDAKTDAVNAKNTAVSAAGTAASETAAGISAQFSQALSNVNAAVTSAQTAAANAANSQTAVANQAVTVAANASAAAASANASDVWAEGSDAQVQALGGEHSAKGWAEVASQGGSNVEVDDATITKRTGDVIQAIAVRNSNDDSPQRIWTGTLQEYTAQGKDQSDDLCIVTDDDPVPATFVQRSEVGVADGVASLDSNGKIPSSELPTMDYIPSAEKGAVNGVAQLDANGKVPSGELPVATSSTVGAVKIDSDYGLRLNSSDVLIVDAADSAQIGNRDSYYNPITPHNLNFAVQSVLSDEHHITLSGEEQQVVQSVLGVYAVLKGSGAPTTSTVGVVGQRYEDTTTQKLYTCTAITVDDSDPENPVTTYTWTDDVNAKGGTFTGNVAIIHPTVTTTSLQMYNDAIVLGQGSTKGTYGSLCVGNSNKHDSARYSLCVGYGLDGHNRADGAVYFGQYNVWKGSMLRLTGCGSSSNRKNAEELSREGDHYISGGHQQEVKVIPSATTEYTLAEGASSHVPSEASTYVLPDVLQVIVVDGMYFTRNTATDGTGYYGWLNGSTNRYTASATPSVGNNTYTNTALTSGAKAITAIDNRTHEIILDVLFAGYARSSADDSGSAYAWKRGANLLYTDTATPTAGTTVAYADTALTTSAGTIALYDSASSSIAMVGTFSFEDSGGNAITPLSTPTIKPGTIVSFLCEWNALDEGWTIMPLVTKEGL